MEVRQALGGRYKLLNELGSGGMAVVWRAHDEVLDRPVAVKVLAARFAGDPQSRARIRDEARAAATLSHPNIAQVYDYGEADEDGTPLPYVVMELVNGPTLQQRMASGPLPPRTVFRICGEVAAALSAAHEDGLVHRDIKMANIMVASAGVKVVDFGIAAAIGPAAPEEMLVGTPAYLAPERLTGDAVEAASDVYALGVLLYRLLANGSPWSVESTTQMLQAHVYVEPEPLPELPGVPDAVAELIDRCLRKAPVERPTATEVSALLADAAEAATAHASSARIPKPAPPAEAPPRYSDAPRYAAGLNDRPAVADAATVRANSGNASRAARTNNSAWPATVVDRPPRSHVAQRLPRKYLLAGGAIAALIVAALVAWFLTGDEKPEGRAQTVNTPASGRPTLSSAPGPPSAGARTNAPVPAATGMPGPGTIVGRGPAPSVVPSGTSIIQPSASVTADKPSPSPEPSTPLYEPPPGNRLDSPGGVAYASCAGGKASLNGAEPAEGFTAQTLEAGPAITARVLFTGARNKYRMAITCVGDTPTPVVLPL